MLIWFRIVASLGASCSQSGTTCADRNAGCQSNGQSGHTCQCTSSYYDSDGLNNIGGTCILSKCHDHCIW
jgi:hypothetical protein